MKTVNQQGRSEILEFLRVNHRYCKEKSNEFFNEEMLDAWARDAEFQMQEGNPPTIEIPAHNTHYGRTIEFCISEAGIDCEEISEEKGGAKNEKIENQALCAEYAAKFGIPYDAGVGVFALIGGAGMIKILTR